MLAVLLAACNAPPAPPPPQSPAVVANIPVGAPPTLLVASPDGAHVYAASNGSLSVIDTSSNAVTMTLDTNPNATGIAIAPNGAKVYVTALFSISLAVLDTAANRFGSPITLPLQRQRGGFSSMAISPDSGTAYIANAINQGLAIVALPSGQGDMPMPEVRPIDVAISPNGRTVYLAGCKPICTPGYIQLLDTASRHFTDQIAMDGNPYRVRVAPDGEHVYATSLGASSLTAIDTATHGIVAKVAVAVQPTGLAISPDSRTVWVTSQTGGALTVVDATTNQVRATVTIAQARDVVVTPDGRRVYVSSAGRVTVLNAAALAPPG